MNLATIRRKVLVPFISALAWCFTLVMAPTWMLARADNEQRGAAESAGFTPKRSGSFVLRSSAVVDGGALPVDYTGDGTGSTLPLEWSGAPTGTKSYVLIMHHIDPEGKTKWYWTLYNIPASVNRLPKNAKGVGTAGNNSINHRVGYAPPHSKGPSPKTYILTVYALSATVQITLSPSEVNRDVLLTGMKNLILDSAELKVVYDRTGIIGTAGKDKLKP
jgi:Raf kinase inhibitor-like YbhB/YbcL family protein